MWRPKPASPSARDGVNKLALRHRRLTVVLTSMRGVCCGIYGAADPFCGQAAGRDNAPGLIVDPVDQGGSRSASMMRAFADAPRTAPIWSKARIVTDAGLFMPDGEDWLRYSLSLTRKAFTSTVGKNRGALRARVICSKA